VKAAKLKEPSGPTRATLPEERSDVPQTTQASAEARCHQLFPSATPEIEAPKCVMPMKLPRACEEAARFEEHVDVSNGPDEKV